MPLVNHPSEHALQRSRAARVLRCAAAVLCAVASGFGLAPVAIAEEPDWSAYNELLQTYVSSGKIAGVSLHQVDYRALKQDPDFSKLIAALAEFPTRKLVGPEETIAFYINAYNILALNVVVDHWPVESIRDIGNIFKPVWKRKAGVINNAPVTLDQLEHEILRPLAEPRIHFAIVCASVSCPDLRTEAFTAGRLDAQLRAQTGEFLSNPNKGMKIDGARISVSKIFKWFEEDFESAGGIDAFIRQYRELPLDVTVKPSLDYNWSLNGL